MLVVLLLPIAWWVAVVRVMLGKASVGNAGMNGHPCHRAVRAIGDEMKAAMSGLVWVFRDRFAEPGWLARFESEGSAGFVEALDAGRPVVLATVHTEAMMLLSRVLAAEGHKAGILVHDAKAHSRRGTADSGLDESAKGLVALLDASDVRAIKRFLSGPRILIVAVDYPRGRVAVVGDPAHALSMRVATGAIRLARSGGAVCRSCVVVQPALARYRLVFGEPVTDGASVETAAEHIGRSILACVRRHPESWTHILRGALAADEGGRNVNQVAATQTVMLEGEPSCGGLPC